MKLLVLAVVVVGTCTAIGITFTIGISLGSMMGRSVLGCAGLHSFVWSHSLQSRISFDRSVTISKKAHHIGGGLAFP